MTQPSTRSDVTIVSEEQSGYDDSVTYSILYEMLEDIGSKMDALAGVIPHITDTGKDGGRTLWRKANDPSDRY